MKKIRNNLCKSCVKSGAMITMRSNCKDGKKTVKTNIEVLKSTQEETDSRIVLHCLYAKQHGYETIQVKSPDSDIFYILLHYID